MENPLSLPGASYIGSTGQVGAVIASLSAAKPVCARPARRLCAIGALVFLTQLRKNGICAEFYRYLNETGPGWRKKC